MDAVRAHLVRRDAQLVLLLTPPFDRMTHDPGLHQGLSAGHSRERRPVHARGALDGDRARAARTRRRRDGAVPHAQPDQPHAHGGRRRALPRRAVRRRGRRLRASDARRPRRLDVVHGLGGLDVSGGDRGAARLAAGRSDVHASTPAFRRCGPATRSTWRVGRTRVSHHRHQSGAPLARRQCRRSSMGSPSIRAPFHFRTMARRTRSP